MYSVMHRLHVVNTIFLVHGSTGMQVVVFGLELECQLIEIGEMHVTGPRPQAFNCGNQCKDF